jgi:hypothetical protein
MNKERLLNVAKALRESPKPERFDMDGYMHPCGTPSCAFGHYAVRADLQDVFTGRAAPEIWKGVDVIGGDADISYVDETVLEHFDITEAQADRLFASKDMAEEYVEEGRADPEAFLALSANTAIAAAEWIERFVAERG